MSTAKEPLERKDEKEFRDEKFTEVSKEARGNDGMTAHERTVLTRKILLKLDLRYIRTDQLPEWILTVLPEFSLCSLCFSCAPS